MFTAPRIIGVIAVLLILIAIVGVIYRKGGESVRIAIERQNNEAGDQSDRARSDFDACPVGLWDFGSGKCRRAP